MSNHLEGKIRAAVTAVGHYVPEKLLTNAELERLAHEKKVSLAWIVREAVEKYLADQWPLLAAHGRKD